MTDWIECNLPYYKSIPPPEDRPSLPDLSEREREQLGRAYKNGLGTEAETKRALDIEARILRKNPTSNPEERKRALKAFVELEQDNKKDVALIARLLDWREFVPLHNRWYEQQPEVIAWREEMDQILRRHYDHIAASSFVGAGLDKPGTLIELERDGEVRQLLIGHLTPNGSAGSGEWLEGEAEAIVRRYKVIWNFEEV